MNAPKSPHEDDHEKKEDHPTDGPPNNTEPAETVAPLRRAQAHAFGKGYIFGQAVRGLMSGAASGLVRNLFDDFLGGG